MKIISKKLGILILAFAFLPACSSSGSGSVAQTSTPVINKYHPQYVQTQEIMQDAMNGDKVAQDDIGTMYYQGSGGLSQSYSEAAKWFEKSAKQGYAEAQLKLGVMYLQGYIEKEKPALVRDNIGVEWLQKAARQGNETAKENLRLISPDLIY